MRDLPAVKTVTMKLFADSVPIAGLREAIPRSVRTWNLSTSSVYPNDLFEFIVMLGVDNDRRPRTADEPLRINLSVKVYKQASEMQAMWDKCVSGYKCPPYVEIVPCSWRRYTRAA